MTRKLTKIACLTAMFLMVIGFVMTTKAAESASSHPDFQTIRSETLNPDSKYYYPNLLKAFLSNDTTMTDDDYYYFYYGSMFQEDYNPYRPNPFADELKATAPLYSHHGHLSRSEKNQILNLAEKSLAHNPFNLMQMSHLVYAYNELGKTNLASIWQHKLNHLLLTIARSGTGADQEHAIVVVDPSNEFDFFILSKRTVVGQEYFEPYYDCLTVQTPGAKDSKKYWFDLHHVLEQYYDKHPGEQQ